MPLCGRIVDYRGINGWKRRRRCRLCPTQSGTNDGVGMRLGFVCPTKTCGTDVGPTGVGRAVFRHNGHYVRIKGGWNDWEVTEGCLEELPPTQVYVGHKLITDLCYEW